MLSEITPFHAFPPYFRSIFGHYALIYTYVFKDISFLQDFLQKSLWAFLFFAMIFWARRRKPLLVCIYYADVTRHAQVFNLSWDHLMVSTLTLCVV
jgi:hypothetical protein